MNYNIAEQKSQHCSEDDNMKKDKRIKTCGNPNCVNHSNKRHFEAEDLYCTRCKEELVYCCSRCGEVFNSTGLDDQICETCKQEIAARKERRKDTADKILRGAGIAAEGVGVAAQVVAGPAGKAIGKAAPVAGKVIAKAAPAAAAAVGVSKVIKK